MSICLKLINHRIKKYKKFFNLDQIGYLQNENKILLNEKNKLQNEYENLKNQKEKNEELSF